MNQSIADTRQQPMANHGDLVSFVNGRVLSKVEVTGYNRYTIDFNNSYNTETKEFMLDQRHRYLLICFYEGVDEL